MKKHLLATLCCLALSCALYAQNGWLPPVQLTYAHLCDNASWKLVFNDDFNGNQLDTTKWLTYFTWLYMPGGDNEHWNGARCDVNLNYIMKDQNITVNNGTCKLSVRRETDTWTCTGCTDPVTYKRHLSAASLTTRYTLPNSQVVGYNTARLEARIRFPLFKGAWCAFWTWYGTRVNEIDVAEAWGGPILGTNRRRNKYSTHAWGPQLGEYNPHNLPYDAAWSKWFSGQSWPDMLFTRSHYHQEDWHTYACEWDDNVLKYYMDQALVYTRWKYVVPLSYTYGLLNYMFDVGSGCDPGNGAYFVNYAYPYDTNSISQIRVTAGTDPNAPGLTPLNPAEIIADSVLNPSTLGFMEIDYVRMWQRHPERDNHTDLCNLGQPVPVINGPDWVCNESNAAFTVTNPVPNAAFNGWGCSWQLSPSSPLNNNSTFTVTGNSTNPYTNGWISYKYTVPGCPYQQVVYKGVSCLLSPSNLPELNVVHTHTNNGLHQFQLFESTYFPNYGNGPYKPTFEWDIDVANGTDDCEATQHYKLFGQHVATPFVSVRQDPNYCLKWKVRITDPATGSIVVKQGERHLGTPLYLQQNDNSVAYFDAAITDVNAYEQSVYNRVARCTVSEDEAKDSIFLNNMIEEIRVDELEPYLNLDTSLAGTASGKFKRNDMKSDTRIYPNPVADHLYIVPGARYVSGLPIQIVIYDLAGSIQKHLDSPFTAGNTLNVSIDDLPNAMYIAELIQGSIKEHCKILKR